jgi:hypothetical protein
MLLAHVDTADAYQAELFAEEAVSHDVVSHDINQNYERLVKADDSLQRHPGPEAATIAGDALLEQESDDSKEYESENLQPHDADSANLEAM